MFAIGLVLLAVGGIGSLVCWIMILIKMFRNEKPLIGVLGILCSLWAFIWGWMKSKVLGLQKLMMLWSLCIVLTIIGNVLYGVGMASKIQNGDFEMQQAPDLDMPQAPEDISPSP